VDVSRGIAASIPPRRDDPPASVALTKPSRTPRRAASRASVGQTSSLLNTSAVGASASSAARASAIASNGSTSRKSTSSDCAKRSALGEK
jgi:hypothetical protein